MHAPAVVTRRPLSRRRFLTGAGAAAISLPLLDAMGPSLGVTSLGRTAFGAEAAAPPRRFVAVCATLGFHTPYLFPEVEGTEFTPTPYLERLAAHRDSLTVFSGLSHPDQQGNNGHASELTWLTAATRPGLAGFRNTVSVDQLIAKRVGRETRFPYLAVSTSGRSMSWSETGVEVPAETSPERLFKALFVDGTENEVAAELRGITRGRSILDTVGTQAKVLERELGGRDREKLDEYLTSVRDLEYRMQQSRGWVTRPKPAVDVEPPRDVTDRLDAIGRQRLMYDMIALALRTDSTRTVTFQLGGMNAVPKVPGVASDWHNLSHHGKDPAKIAELRRVEEAEFDAFAGFLSSLSAATEGTGTVLDHTAVLFGSNLGNASAHDWRNLPVLVAGGGHRAAGHVAHDPTDNTPFANLLLSLAQRTGVEARSFGTSTAEGLRGLEWA